MAYTNDNTQPQAPDDAEPLCVVRIYKIPGDAPDEGEILTNIEPVGTVLNDEPKILVAGLTFAIAAIQRSCADLAKWIKER